MTQEQQQQQQQQSKFYDFVCELMKVSGKEVTTFESVVSMLHTLIINNYLDEVDAIFRREFPDYYVDTEQSEKDRNSKDVDDFFPF